MKSERNLGLKKKVRSQSRAVIKRELERADWEHMYKNLDTDAADLERAVPDPVPKLVFK